TFFMIRSIVRGMPPRWNDNSAPLRNPASGGRSCLCPASLESIADDQEEAARPVPHLPNGESEPVPAHRRQHDAREELDATDDIMPGMNPVTSRIAWTTPRASLRPLGADTWRRPAGTR